MSIESIMDSVRAGDFARQPEGVSFKAMTDDEDTARSIGQLLARRLRPDRRWGKVLYAELREDADGVPYHEVVVEDLGAVYRTTKARTRR